MFHYISLMRLCKWICRKYINDLQVWFGPITRHYCQKLCLYWLKLGSSMTSDEFCWKWEFGTIHKLCFYWTILTSHKTSFCLYFTVYSHSNRFEHILIYKNWIQKVLNQSKLIYDTNLRWRTSYMICKCSLRGY